MNDPRLRRSVQQSLDNYSYYGDSQAQTNLQASCKNSLDFVQRLQLLKTLNVHSGCVNTVNWNANGSYIVSGSDDNHLVITETKSGRVALKSKTLHKRHIFSARFMPQTNDQAVISCSGEGIVMHTEFLAPYGAGKANLEDALIGDDGRIASVFDCHKFGSTYDVLPLPDTPRSFLSCGEDGTVRCFDLRATSRCTERVCHRHIFIMAPCAVTAMDVAPINHHSVAIGCSDSIVRLYDRRMLRTLNPGDISGAADSRQATTLPLKAYPIPMKYTRRHYRPTCVKFNADESELLVSYSMEQLYLFDLKHAGYDDGELLRSGCYTPKLRRDDDPEPQMPRLRFRGDWSDTGPNSLAAFDQGAQRPNVGQARPPLEPGVLSRLSDEIFRMLNSQSRQTRLLQAQAQAQSSSSPAATSWQNVVLRTLDSHRETAAAANREAQSAEPAADGMDVEVDGESVDKVDAVDAVAAGDKQQYPLAKFDYVKMSFSGHRNSRTMVKGACFWGDDYIMSGSDCGHIFVWQRHTGKVVKTLLADNRVVNRVQPHPTLPYLLSSGIDYNVKMWAPIAATPTFDELETNGLIKSNEIMLVETRDTITVPAQIMIRILASLHQYRRLLNANGEANEAANEAATDEPANAEGGAENEVEEAAAAGAMEANVGGDNDDNDDNANGDDSAEPAV